MANPRCTTTTPLEVHEPSSKEHRSVQYIDTVDASVYPKVCYYPVTEGSRPVGCVPPVEDSPETDFDLRASSKMSAAVRLNPTDLTVPVTLEQSSRLCSASNKLEAFASSLRRLADGALRCGATQRISAVFAASEEVPECDSGHRTSLRWCEVMRLTESPTCVVGTPKNKFLGGMVLRLAPKTAAEVSYNPPSHSLSDLPGRPPPAQDPHQRIGTNPAFRL
jgi:hypothetical protein